jgi:hypothetical protein
MSEVNELEERIRKAEIEKERRYPLLNIVDNRKEIRDISMAAQDYMSELNPELKKIKVWEAIPRIVIEFIQASFTKLSRADAMNNGSSSIIIGDIMELGVDGLRTNDGDKDGNITPLIKCRSEFKYENVNLPYRDEISADDAAILREENCEGLPVQFFDNREEIKEISIIAKKSLETNYGIMFGNSDDWYIIPLIVVAFFRKTRDYLVKHKDDGEIGVAISFANLLKIGIIKEGGIEEGDPVDYFLYINPEQVFKKDNAKGDDITESK